MSTPTIAELARMIDHSLLHPTMTDAELRAGLELACQYACVKPYSVPLAAELLAGSGVGVCSVAGFPHGNSHPEVIVAEAVRHGFPGPIPPGLEQSGVAGSSQPA